MKKDRYEKRGYGGKKGFVGKNGQEKKRIVILKIIFSFPYSSVHSFFFFCDLNSVQPRAKKKGKMVKDLFLCLLAFVLFFFF